MTFEEANTIVKSTDDYQKDKEATEAFGIKYATLQPCRECRHRGICKMISPLVYKCNFFAPRVDINYIINLN
jgi:hypothetical protein